MSLTCVSCGLRKCLYHPWHTVKHLPTPERCIMRLLSSAESCSLQQQPLIVTLWAQQSLCTYNKVFSPPHLTVIRVCHPFHSRSQLLMPETPLLTAAPSAPRATQFALQEEAPAAGTAVCCTVVRGRNGKERTCTSAQRSGAITTPIAARPPRRQRVIMARRAQRRRIRSVKTNDYLTAPDTDSPIEFFWKNVESVEKSKGSIGLERSTSKDMTICDTW